MKRFGLGLLLAVLLCAQAVAHANVLSTSTGGTATDGGGGSYGQGFVVGGAGSYNNISFSFLKSGGSTYAVGTGYLVMNAYFGNSGGLSAVAFGSAASSGGAYTFGPSVVLTSGQTYYLYEDAFPAPSSFAITRSGSGSLYFYGVGGGNFVNFYGNTDDYIVTGTPFAGTGATPEPSSIALLATGMLSAAGFVRRRFSAQVA